MTSKVKNFLNQHRRLVILILATLPVMFAYQNCGSVGSQKMLASGGNGPVLIVDPGFTDPVLAATVQQVNQIKTQAAASEAQGVANCTSVDAEDSLPVRLRGDVSGLTYTTQGQNPDGIDHDDVYELVDLVLRHTFNDLRPNDKWAHAQLYTDLNCDGRLDLADVVKLLFCVKGEVSIVSCTPQNPGGGSGFASATPSPLPTPLATPPASSSPTPSPIPTPNPSPYSPQAFIITPNPFSNEAVRPLTFWPPDDGSQSPCGVGDLFLKVGQKFYFEGVYTGTSYGQRNCTAVLNLDTGKFQTHYDRGPFAPTKRIKDLHHIKIEQNNNYTYLTEIFDSNLNFVGKANSLFESSNVQKIVRDGQNLYLIKLTINAYEIYKTTIQEYIQNGSTYQAGKVLGQKVATIKGTGEVTAIKNGKILGHYLEGNRFYSHDMSVYAPDWMIGDVEPSGYYSNSFAGEVVKSIQYENGSIFILTYLDGGASNKTINLYKSTDGLTFAKIYTFGPSIEISGTSLKLLVQSNTIFVQTGDDYYSIPADQKPYYISNNGGTAFTRLQIGHAYDSYYGFKILNGALYGIRHRVVNGHFHEYREFVKFTGAMAQTLKNFDLGRSLNQRDGLSLRQPASATVYGDIERSVYSWDSAFVPKPAPSPRPHVGRNGVYLYSKTEGGTYMYIYRRFASTNNSLSIEESTNDETGFTPVELPSGLSCVIDRNVYYLTIKCDGNRKFIRYGNGFAEISNSTNFDGSSVVYSTPKYFYYANSTGTFRLLKTSSQPWQPVQVNSATTILDRFGTSIISVGWYGSFTFRYLATENGPNLSFEDYVTVGFNVANNSIYHVTRNVAGAGPGMLTVKKYNFEGALLLTKQVELFSSGNGSQWTVDHKGMHHWSGMFMPMDF